MGENTAVTLDSMRKLRCFSIKACKPFIVDLPEHEQNMSPFLCAYVLVSIQCTEKVNHHFKNG